MNTPNPPSLARFQLVVGQLRELLSKATPGPWFDDPEGDRCRVFSAHIPNGRYACITPVVCETMPWTGGRRSEGLGNAALIVAAVNALPALLAIAEAAALVADDQIHMENCAAICGPAGEQWLEESRCNCAMPRLRTALSLLPNPSDQRAADKETT